MNARDLAATKIYFSANKIAANPSFLSERNYVNITEQYKKECALILTPLQSLKVRSHQTRMKRYAQIIYMLSQCKSAIDNLAALFARMRRTRIERLGHLTRDSHKLNIGGY